MFSATFADPEFKGETERMLQFQPLAFATKKWSKSMPPSSAQQPDQRAIVKKIA